MQVAHRLVRAGLGALATVLAACAPIPQSERAAPAPRAPAQEDQYLPIYLVGSLESKDRVSFVWSADCDRCRSVFRKEFWPLVRSASAGTGPLVSLMQYEEGAERIERNVVEPVCHGRPIYNAYAIGQLLGGFSLTQTLSTSAVGGMARSGGCRDRAMARHEAEAAMEYLGSKYGRQLKQLPIVTLNGRVVSMRELQRRFQHRG